MNGYKEAILDLADPLREQDKKALSAFEAFFKKTDFKLDVSESQLVIYVNKLDFHSFKGMADALSREFETKILFDVLNKVEAIKSYGLKSNYRVYIDYNKERKVKNRKQKEKQRGQYYYARDNDFKDENHAVPVEYLNKIICGDSEQVLKSIPENTVDLVVTSPPYNFGLEYEVSKDDQYWDEYFRKLFLVFDECIRVLKYGGRMIVNVQPLLSDYIPTHHIISNHFLKRKLIWKGEILWEKNNYNCKYTAWGSWKSPSNPYLKTTWEYLEVFCKGSLKMEGDRENADITADEFKEWTTVKWSLAPERNMKDWGHPAMFPEKLIDRVLKLFSFRNGVVLDPFNGVGTTTAVAQRCGRKYVGIELSKKYCAIAQKRIKDLCHYV